MTAVHIPQNFYKQTITRAVTLTGATNIYVSAHPTPDVGYITISPSSSILREIIFYTVKGTDGNGTFITVTLENRGLGGTTAQTHVIGEAVRMNVDAETIQEISDAIDQIVAAGAQDATASIKGISRGASETELGIVEEATDAEVTAGTATGATGAKLFITPAKLLTRFPGSDVQNFVASGTWTKPANAKAVEVICIGGGGGGGRSTNNAARAGGGGGGGGFSRMIFPASILGATETVTVGAGGTGAIANATNGVSGGDTTFGIWLKAGGGTFGPTGGSPGGAGGQGMGSTGSAGGVTEGVAGTAAVLSGAGGGGGSTATQVTGGAGGAGNRFGAAGGGAGGGQSNGGTGGSQSYRGTTINGGTGASGNGGVGGSATDVTANEATPGAGGGGGSDAGSGSAGAGGNGGKYGGGGGGGGGANTTSGNGGNGAVGICQVITYF